MNDYQDVIISLESTLPKEIIDLLFPVEIVTDRYSKETVFSRRKDLDLDEYELAMSAFPDETHTETGFLQTISCLLSRSRCSESGTLTRRKRVA